ncbi:non-hydrolyzing UDP-N-acetylglucosamine 2-epimerase [Leifsonia sp. 21MFCrub1.1]|uniref:non-hydrolyzing UDP-N-acetylglucosamine 2-epimerase n=1 Tax=Leifsonia sp. 21MFCrub1.1 TaxID=1798223 RepID=UPI0008928F73|nr:UDP-N-acetylglucosamine 2-epimerase (non-hydrolyzing) [Leifsonia sp. 21MFCrub1.1]SEB00558.1 UDP-N-acetylglucosamine 2-epimerase (non-hydrolysing) [Leifsonia sp. 21MFCrub1.1]
MRVLSVVGARPQFVKLAPIARAFAGEVDHVVVHTGQHYDELLSDVFFRDLGIPAPQVNLAIGSGSHGAQTGAMLTELEPVLERFRPDWVLVYGDTNSTLAAAVASVKLGLPLAHLEAGLRSFNRAMPEEHNRVLTDHAADLLLAPTEVAVGHLRDEGLADRTLLVGDVMTDVLLQVRDQQRDAAPVFPEYGEGEYYVATLHRPANTDDPARLASILTQLSLLARPVILLAHPRLRAAADVAGVRLDQGAIDVRDPLAYPDLVSVVARSAGVITDSGGLQKEAFLLRVPCTTVRSETEWVETIDLGWNVLADGDLSTLRGIVERDRPAPTDAAPYGDGHAAERVLEALSSRA